MGSINEADLFYQVFLAPGVLHCSRGSGVVPEDPM